MSKNQYTMVFPLGAENSSMRSASYEYESPKGTFGFSGKSKFFYRIVQSISSD